MAKLYFYYSAMNAGKTTTLLQSSYNYQERGMDTLIFTPIFDDRYTVGTVTSRIGLKENASTFDETLNFYTHISACFAEKPALKCILIDEAHFLKKPQVEQLTDVANKLNIPVLAYGLRTDFRGETFEGSQYLLAWAETLVEIKTICHCGRKATMNIRIDDAGNMVIRGDQTEIGGNDRYIAACRKHFSEAKEKAQKIAEPETTSAV